MLVQELLEGETPVGKPQRFLRFLVLDVDHADQWHICIVSILAIKLITLRRRIQTKPLILVSGSVLIGHLKRLSTASASLHGFILVLLLFVIDLKDDLVDFLIMHII